MRRLGAVGWIACGWLLVGPASASWSAAIAAGAGAASAGIVAQGCRLENPRRCLELGDEFAKKNDDISALEAFGVACAAKEADGCQRVAPFVARLVGRGWLVGNIDQIRKMTLSLTTTGAAQPGNMELRVSRLWIDAARVRRLECKGFQGDFEVSEVHQFAMDVAGSSQPSTQFRYVVVAGWVPFVDRAPCLFSKDTKVRLSSSEAATVFGADRAGTYRVDSQSHLRATVRVGNIDLRRDIAAAAAALAIMIMMLLAVRLRRRAVRSRAVSA